jgi:hypothetical protein
MTIRRFFISGNRFSVNFTRIKSRYDARKVIVNEIEKNDLKTDIYNLTLYECHKIYEAIFLFDQNVLIFEFVYFPITIKFNDYLMFKGGFKRVTHIEYNNKKIIYEDKIYKINDTIITEEGAKEYYIFSEDSLSKE